MASALRRTTAGANRAATGYAGVAFDSGVIKLYTGTQPATADTAIGSQVLLVQCAFAAGAFGTPTAGSMTANQPTIAGTVTVTGDANWFRVLQSDGTTKEFDGTVGVSGCDLNFAAGSLGAGGVGVHLTLGQVIRISSATIAELLT